MTATPVYIRAWRGSAEVNLSSGPLVLTGQSTFTGTATVVSAASANLATIKMADATMTLTGTTSVTTAQGAVTIGTQTLTDGSAVTVTSYASLYVAGQPVAAGSVTITDAYAVNVAAGRSLFTPTRTVASATSAELSGFHVASATITLTGTTQTTTATGFVRLGQATLTDGSAVTVDTYATLYIKDAPTSAGSVTLTAAYALWVDAGNVRLDGNLTVSGGTITTSAAATSLVIIANTAVAYRIYDGTVAIVNYDTRNTVTGVSTTTFTSPSITVAGASGTTSNNVVVAAKTLTTSTTTGITALDGLQLQVNAPTINQSGGAVTVTTVSSVYLQKPVAGSSVTITNNRYINTDTAGCFLTAAGVWTDASSVDHKEDIVTVAKGAALALLDTIRPVTFKYRPGHDDGLDTERFGVIAEEVPDFLASPDHKGVGSIHLAGYLLAVVRDLKDEIASLKAAQAAV